MALAYAQSGKNRDNTGRFIKVTLLSHSVGMFEKAPRRHQKVRHLPERREWGLISPLIIGPTPKAAGIKKARLSAYLLCSVTNPPIIPVSVTVAPCSMYASFYDNSFTQQVSATVENKEN